jgi:non-heme chloroperoxidase
MDTLVVSDGTRIAFKDWGPRTGPAVVFSHGWPLSADAWDDQMLFLTERGFRCVAHDRRGHGRSSQPAHGNDMNGYADDLAELVRALDLRDVTHVGHSTGGGEVTRYVGRHGTSRVAKIVLIGAVPPQMLRSAWNPEGLPTEAFDAIRAGVRGDRSSFYRAIAAGPFFGFNRPGATVSQGLIDSFWMQGMQSGIVASYECIKAFSETDFRADLAKFDRPTLFLHGDDDQVVPIASSALQAVKLVKHATLKIYPRGSHAIATINKDEVNADLLAFLNG